MSESEIDEIKRRAYAEGVRDAAEQRWNRALDELREAMLALGDADAAAGCHGVLNPRPEALGVETETTGPHGGAAGKGGRSSATFKTGGGTNAVVVKDRDGRVLFDSELGLDGRGIDDFNVMIVARGDWEQAGLVDALIRAALELRAKG